MSKGILAGRAAAGKDDSVRRQQLRAWLSELAARGESCGEEAVVRGSVRPWVRLTCCIWACK